VIPREFWARPNYQSSRYGVTEGLVTPKKPGKINARINPAFGKASATTIMATHGGNSVIQATSDVARRNGRCSSEPASFAAHNRVFTGAVGSRAVVHLGADQVLLQHLPFASQGSLYGEPKKSA
jgi:hypothetical protein